MNKLKKLLGDFFGLARVCGVGVAFKWLSAVVANLPAIVKVGDLQPADRALGAGPFRVALKRYRAGFSIAGAQAVSGIREMYVRDVYLRDGWLRINDGDTVLDLGANMGNFTNLALSMGPNVRVVAVEPNQASNDVFVNSVGNNPGFLARVRLVRACLGEASAWQNSSLSDDPDYAGAPWMSEDELIELAGLKTIDVLKCDIEGGEFFLLNPASKLLSMAKALAIEVHAFAGDVGQFVADLESCGFTLGPAQTDPDGTMTFPARRL